MKTTKSSKIMIGLEIHVQLSGKKLFCSCPTEGENIPGNTFRRVLHTVSGERGYTDPAVLYERIRNRTFQYIMSTNSCLVEADEEPPHAPNGLALREAVAAAMALKCTILPYVSYMRKIVVDGSNTSGFQRTAIIGLNGSVDTSRGKVRISTLCLEEDSCRKVEEETGQATYGLDRLGVPLLEISTEPDILDPDHAVEVASKIGEMLIYAGWVRRGADSIRQDVNFSMGMGRVEIKGVQKLTDIKNAIIAEMERQEWIIDLRTRLRGKSEDIRFHMQQCDEIFSATNSKVLKRSISSGLHIYAALAPHLKGFLKYEKFRLGKEFSEMVRAFGGGGLVHSDELPAFGISAEEMDRVARMVSAGPDDGFLIITCNPSQQRNVEESLNSRFQKLMNGDLSETRYLTPEGLTAFLRPLPGGERMYPETDVPVIPVDEAMLQQAESMVPADPASLLKRVTADFNISPQDAETIILEGLLNDFTEIANVIQDPRLAARILIQVIPVLEHEAGRKLENDEIVAFVKSIGHAIRDRPGVEAAFRMHFIEGKTVDDILRSDRIKPLSREEMKALIIELAAKKKLDRSNIIPSIRSATGRTFDPRVALEIYNDIEEHADT
ncbi:MAG: Glu-tRNA(Gln) amidotransferase subunit GatE [Thermoplasmataceae archaeon]